MASLRELRRKIKSVKSTQQITKAMKMVAAARMRRAQTAIVSARPFAVKLEETVHDLAAGQPADEAAAPAHPFFRAEPDDPNPCLLLVTADRGLCGSFNATLLRAAAQWLVRNGAKRPSVALVGRKGRDFIRRLRAGSPEGKAPDVLAEIVGIFPKAGFQHAELVGQPLIEAFLERRVSSVTALYNEFRSVVSQGVVEKGLLPVSPLAPGETRALSFGYEPARPDLLAALLPRHLKAQIYRVLLESQAAELAARMNAMDSATRNAADLIEHLTLELNRTRQASITREIAELVGGAEALAA